MPKFRNAIWLLHALGVLAVAAPAPAVADSDKQALSERLLDIIDASDDYGDRHFIREVTDEVCPWITVKDLEGLVSNPGPQFTGHFDDFDPQQRTYWLKKVAERAIDRKGLQVGLGNKGCYAYVRRADAI